MRGRQCRQRRRGCRPELMMGVMRMNAVLVVAAAVAAIAGLNLWFKGLTEKLEQQMAFEFGAAGTK